MTVEQRTASTTANNPRPLYLRTYRQLADDIAHGVLKAGERLPAERVLCETLGVSRLTLRRALEVLAQDGLLAPSVGRGWFVTDGPLAAPTSFVSFTAMGAARGLAATARVLRMHVRPATFDEAEVLSGAPGHDLFELERLRMLDGVVVAIDHSRVPLQRCPSLLEIDFTTASLYTILEERAGLVASRCAYVVAAASADEQEAGVLEVAVGAPLLITHQTVYDQFDRVVELGRVLYRHDRFRFRAELTGRFDTPTRTAP